MPSITPERRADMLAELAELSMSLAEHLGRAAGEAKTAKEAAALAGAFVALTDEVRATLEQEQELRREISRRRAVRRLAEARRAAALPPPADGGAVH